MGISVWQLVILAVVVILIFGTKKLRGMGKDLGGAVKDFKSAMTDEERKAKEEEDGKPAANLEHKEADANFNELNTKDKDKTK